MQTLIGTSPYVPSAQALGVRVMLLTTRPDGLSARRLVGYGSLVDIESTLDAAVAALMGDPLGFDLFVMDCDGFGGVEGGEHAVATLIAAGARMRIMLVSRDFEEAAYPLGRRTAVCLPETVSDDGFRRGFDHVLRDRAAMVVM